MICELVKLTLSEPETNAVVPDARATCVPVRVVNSAFQPYVPGFAPVIGNMTESDSAKPLLLPSISESDPVPKASGKSSNWVCRYADVV